MDSEFAALARDPSFRRPHHGYANGCVCEACVTRSENFSSLMDDPQVLELYPDFEDRYAYAAQLSVM